MTPTERRLEILSIERGHYRRTLEVAKEAVWSLWRAAIAGHAPSDSQLAEIAHGLEEGWRFRLVPCPKCGGPSTFNYLSLDPDHNHMAYHCGSCGVAGGGDS